MPGAGVETFYGYVEFGCGNKNMGTWARRNLKKRVGGLVSPGGMVKIDSKVKW